MREDKGVPKSLHTISAIINVARHVAAGNGMGPKPAVQAALKVLGLNGRPDPDGLADKALALLKARK
jgi:hypothetical protein